MTSSSNANPDVQRGPRRVLYIYPDTVGLHSDPKKNPLHYLSAHLEGDYLCIWIVPDAATASARAREAEAAHGRFGFHWLRVNRLPKPIQRLSHLFYYVLKGLRLARRRGGYDAIVTYGPFTTGLAGLILRRLIRAKLIVEFTGHPFRSFDLHPGRVNRLKRRVAPLWTRYIASAADHVRLLYPWQLDELGIDLTGKVSVFHNFTTVSSMPAPETEPEGDRYVFFLGFPFLLKGVDLLIRAFNAISDEFPDCRLLIVGHCPDPAPYLELAQGNPRIEIRRPVPHDTAMRLMAGSSVFVLPSRTEAMGRVLLEAMAAERPIIASAVGGIPYYIKHEERGLLFEPENTDQLAAHLRRLLRAPDYASRLAHRGYLHVHASLSEERYAQEFSAMVERALKPPPPLQRPAKASMP